MLLRKIVFFHAIQRVLLLEKNNNSIARKFTGCCYLRLLLWNLILCLICNKSYTYTQLGHTWIHNSLMQWKIRGFRDQEHLYPNSYSVTLGIRFNCPLFHFPHLVLSYDLMKSHIYEAAKLLNVLFLNPLKSFPTMPRPIKPTLWIQDKLIQPLSGGCILACYMQHDVKLSGEWHELGIQRKEVEKLAG